MSDQPIADKGSAQEERRYGSTASEAAEFFHLIREERAREFDRGYQLGRDLLHIANQLEAFLTALGAITTAQIQTATQLNRLADVTERSLRGHQHEFRLIREQLTRLENLLTPAPPEPAVRLDLVAGPPTEQKV